MTLNAFIAALEVIRNTRQAGAWPVYAEGTGGAYEPTPVTDLLAEHEPDAVLLVPDVTTDEDGHRSSLWHVFELREGA